MPINHNFDKIFAVDTNIILDDAYNIFNLSQDGKNLIVIPETVLDEIDIKKSGNFEISYQARQFGRLLYDSKINDIEQLGYIKIIETKVKNTTIYIISLDNYEIDENTDRSIINDRKILQAINVFKNTNGFDRTTFISLDVMARTRAISMGINAEPLNLGIEENIDNLFFHDSIHIEDYNGRIESLDLSEYSNLTSIEITNNSGNKFYYYRNKNNQWTEVDDKNKKKFSPPPINLQQKVAMECIYNETPLVCLEGKAGSGKTLIAFSAAKRLVDTKEYNKIYYIRKTIVSDDQEGELGFLPGTLEEKMAGYNQPMEDAISKSIRMQKKDINKEELELEIEKTKQKYDITYPFIGHMRGTNLDEKSIVIVDEFQNISISVLKTLISRVSKHSIVICLGSINQIDSRFLTKNNNGLSAIIRQSKMDNSIEIRTIKLKNIIRSEIAEWVDKTF